VKLDQFLNQRQAIPLPRECGCGVLDAMEAVDKAVGVRLAGIPTPVSLTRNSTLLPASTSATVIVPSKVNLKAFEMRLRTIFSHMLRSM